MQCHIYLCNSFFIFINNDLLFSKILLTSLSKLNNISVIDDCFTETASPTFPELSLQYFPIQELWE